MEFNYQIIAIAVVLISLLIVNIIIKRTVKKFAVLKNIEPNRRKVILNLVFFLSYTIALIAIIGILQVEFRQLLIFISSILAVLGVGFFAQWSVLSNLTSSFILFFYHPVRIGDKIRILDKDFDLTGKVADIKGFYVLLKTEDKKLITLPTQILLQKGIELIHESPDTENKN